MKPKAPLLLSLILLLPLLSGCVQQSEKEDAGEQLDMLMEIRSSPWSPAIINSTVVPGEVTWRIDKWSSYECQFSNHRATIKVYDRSGYQATHDYWIEPKDTTLNFTIPLPGESPWIVAGIGPICAIWPGVSITGVTDGFEALFLRSQEKWLETQIPIEVPVGETSAEVTWTPSPEVWWLIQMIHRADDREGERYGTISANDANGNVTRWDKYHRTEGKSLGYPAFILVDGPYTLRLELDAPAIVPTEWRYTIQYMEFDDDVCPYGFDWSIC